MTTREQRLRELVEKWRNPKWEATNDDEQGFMECLGYCADELAAILAEPVEVSAEMVERFETALYENVSGFDIGNGFMTRAAVREALTAALNFKEPGQ